MARKRYKPEEIVAKLWQVDVLVSQGARELRAGSIGTSCVDHPSPSLANDRFAPLSASPPAVAARSAEPLTVLRLLQALYEGITAGKQFRIVRSQAAPEHAYAPHALALLRARRERPRGRCAAEKRDELPALDHSITSSAIARS